MADTVRQGSPTSFRSSFESMIYTNSAGSEHQLLSDGAVIPLQNLGPKTPESKPSVRSLKGESTTTIVAEGDSKAKAELDEIYNGMVDGSYHVPSPQHYRGGILSQMLKLYNQPDIERMRNFIPRSASPGSPSSKIAGSTSATGATTPERRKWYNSNGSQDTLATLVQASSKLAKPAQPQSEGKPSRPKHSRKGSSVANRLSALWHQEETQVRTHIEGTLARQDFIIKECQALMKYGAPTHRLEEYLNMTARALAIEAHFLYIPGCMIISFDDQASHTTEVKLVRLAQGIDLGRLKDVHRVYKEVIHDVIAVEEATGRLDEIMAKKDKFNPWLRVVIFGLTSVTAAPFSFSARFIDLPLLFCFGCLVGTLQLILSPRSPLYSNVFEISATVLVTFLARAFGSLRGGELFCFSALTQGGIVLLLPGYMFLSSSLEIQAKAIVPGSIRIIYGVVYSLLLGFGITVGSALYGLVDKNATSALTCSDPFSAYIGFAFVPPFVLCISILYQAKWRQMPVMVMVAFAGYVVNYFSTLRFTASPQIASSLGAFAVGALANIYSRFRHGVAAAILIPAIFTQVPGGLASNGGLLSGLSVANQITNITTQVNGTSYEKLGMQVGSPTNYVVFNVASSMIQIAIGITVGLFMSALVVYPLGKKKSGLFSF